MTVELLLNLGFQNILLLKANQQVNMWHNGTSPHFLYPFASSIF